jgi:hypothetical protein
MNIVIRMSPTHLHGFSQTKGSGERHCDFSISFVWVAPTPSRLKSFAISLLSSFSLRRNSDSKDAFFLFSFFLAMKRISMQTKHMQVHCHQTST